MNEDRVTALAGALAQLDERGAFDYPGLFAPATKEHYARRLVWLEPNSRFIIIAMTWLPGQASPLHDHAGLWGAEIVVDGEMHETPFGLMECDGDRYRFARGLDRVVKKGAIGILNPPLEYHDFGNKGTTVAHTLHVYSGNLESCRAYDADSEGWRRSRHVDLRYDA
jgi:predicted metal-dependent enzyme (double-stranded beta helix superfamily)